MWRCCNKATCPMEPSRGYDTTCPLESLQHVHCNSVPWAGCSVGHVARASWDMLQGLQETCCKGSMEHVARAMIVARTPWDMLHGLV